MEFREVKSLLTEKVGWNVTDVYYLCTDKALFTYYIVYKNHRIKCVAAIDELNGLMSGIWN